MLIFGTNRRPKAKSLALKDYFLHYLLTFILPIPVALMIVILAYAGKVHKDISDSVFKGIKERASFIIEEQINSQRQRVLLYKKDIRNFAEVVSSHFLREVEKGKNYQEIDLSPFKNSFYSTFPRNVFQDVNFYVISREGKVIFTDYGPDLGLDLSQFKSFWESLQKALDDTLLFHIAGYEVVSGKWRVFVYKRLPNGDIFEIGFLLEAEKFYEALGKLKGLSIFLEKIGVYNVAGIPLREDFPPLPKKPLSWHPFKREIITKIEIPDFPPYTQELTLYIRLNFFSTFKPVLVSSLALLIYTILSYILSSVTVKNLSREFDLLDKAVSSFKEDRQIYVDPSFSKVEEVRNILETFNKAAETINSEIKENKRLLKELKEAFFDFAERLAFAAEGHDPETAQHLRRVKSLTKLIVDRLDLPEEKKEEIVNFSVLHDIGKIYIPLSIIYKSGPLTQEEWEVIKQHPLLARRLLDHPRFKTALDIALYHHENYDGSGYPFGLAGKDIPLVGRILKIVDVYDALRSKRPYKEPFPYEKAIEIMKNGDQRVKPEHFDPELLKIFLEEIGKVDPILYGEEEKPA